jgi:hypothetical protein
MRMDKKQRRWAVASLGILSATLRMRIKVRLGRVGAARSA